ncbi:hypothetical protein DAPPUDRAFT_264299 [Daphnia pulex]|uniref:RNase III domain-containing protein n=1 Tax=Daphnia pulex TaxID=6669 RepID=E9HRA8_DAPPU|nr:hypothetical protein DAPPUDRAFT_264299 [Daphnia pulex]|eukprot:EFX65721.1 hypothetical protein DAPPUDRAFT_264299 [Daphnia pulex]
MWIPLFCGNVPTLFYGQFSNFVVTGQRSIASSVEQLEKPLVQNTRRALEPMSIEPPRVPFWSALNHTTKPNQRIRTEQNKGAPSIRKKSITENLNATAESLLVPGVLADLFESVGGAIYKNSGFSRKAVLKSYTLFLVHAYATPENGYATAESLLVPGVLADLFEAVADAIYKDSGYSRKAVVKSFAPFLYQAYVN